MPQPQSRPPSDRREHVEMRGNRIYRTRPDYPPEHERVEEIDEGMPGEEREEYSQDVVAERENQINRITSVVWLVFGVLEVLIAFRVLLKLLAANPENGFANFIYNISYPFLAPFFGLVGTPSSDGNVLEISSLVAMLVYLFLAWLIVRIIELAMRPTQVRSTRTYSRR